MIKGKYYRNYIGMCYNMRLSEFEGKVCKNVKNNSNLGRKGLKILKLHPEVLKEYQEICSNLFNTINQGTIEIGDNSKYNGEYNQQRWLSFLDKEDILRHRELKTHLLSWTKDIERFNRITLMKYAPNYVFPAHIDGRYSDKNDKIAMITVDGTATVIFKNPKTEEQHTIEVEPGHVIIIRNRMRYDWTHELHMGDTGRTAIIMRNLRFLEELEKEYKLSM